MPQGLSHPTDVPVLAGFGQWVSWLGEVPTEFPCAGKRPVGTAHNGHCIPSTMACSADFGCGRNYAIPVSVVAAIGSSASCVGPADRMCLSHGAGGGRRPASLRLGHRTIWSETSPPRQRSQHLSPVLTTDGRARSNRQADVNIMASQIRQDPTRAASHCPREIFSGDYPSNLDSPPSTDLLILC